jgi:hypothetical protein
MMGLRLRVRVRMMMIMIVRMQVMDSQSLRTILRSDAFAHLIF